MTAETSPCSATGSRARPGSRRVRSGTPCERDESYVIAPLSIFMLSYYIPSVTATRGMHVLGRSSRTVGPGSRG